MSLCDECLPECEHDYCDNCTKCHSCGQYAGAPAAPVYPAGYPLDRNYLPGKPVPVRVPSGFSDEAYYAYVSKPGIPQSALVH